MSASETFSILTLFCLLWYFYYLWIHVVQVPTTAKCSDVQGVLKKLVTDILMVPSLG